jgi:hypothetical protein
MAINITLPQKRSQRNVSSAKATAKRRLSGRLIFPDHQEIGPEPCDTRPQYVASSKPLTASARVHSERRELHPRRPEQPGQTYPDRPDLAAASVAHVLHTVFPQPRQSSRGPKPSWIPCINPTMPATTGSPAARRCVAESEETEAFSQSLPQNEHLSPLICSLLFLPHEEEPGRPF